jgi:hypothetical protein
VLPGHPRLASKGSPVPFPPAPQGGFPEDRVVWVFGHPRSGTTWLGQLLTDGLALMRETRKRRDAWLAKRVGALTPEERRVLAEATRIMRGLADS